MIGYNDIASLLIKVRQSDDPVNLQAVLEQLLTHMMEEIDYQNAVDSDGQGD